MTELSCSLNGITLTQANAFQSTLNIRMGIKSPSYTNPVQTGYMQIVGVKAKLRVQGNKPSQFEIGVADQEQLGSVRFGDTATLDLTLRLSPYLLHRIEELRSGGDLHFQFEPITSGLAIFNPGGTLNNVDVINFQINGNTWKYPRSEWIDHLNTIEFNRIELIEIPKIEFKKIALTEEIVKFLSESDKAMNEGRYGDVLQECRKALDSLESGIDEWAKNQTFSEPEIAKINQNNGKEKREVYLSKLIGDSEKAKRLNVIKGNLHSYLSLDPHQPEYKGMEFTRDDAKFVIYAVTGLINNILKYLISKQN